MVTSPPDPAAQRADAVELKSGALRLALRPDLGGCVAGLWHHHVPVWRSTEPQQLDAASQPACVPLVPFVGRLGHARFRWDGTEHRLAADAGVAPHALDGSGRRARWTLRSFGPLDASLALAHAADAHWPFAFEAVQHFSLTPQAVRVQMTVTNTSGAPQPVGLGWRIALPRRLRSRLHAELAARWHTDPSGLPTRKVEQPGIDADVARLALDDGFDGWRGAVRIRDEKFSLQLTSSMSRLLVATPPDGDAFTLAPVSHVVNAIHMADPAAHGIAVIAPGESIDAWMKLEVAPI